MTRYALSAAALVALCVSLLPADDKKPEAPKDGEFKPLFNDKNLDGWVNVNCHPDTFFVKGEEIVTTGNPTGFLRTDRQYENFVLEFDWMHVEKEKMANSGLFVWGDPLPAVGTGYTRGIEVQVLVNYAPKDGWATSHGDIFSIWGAKCTPDRPHPTRKGLERCLPSENRVKGGGEWNHYKVIANDGAIKLEVNGKEVSGVSKCSPRKGYLALESEGAECHFKNLKIKELPSTNPKPEECAKVAEGHVSLFNGLDFKGWKHWSPAGNKVETEWAVKGGVMHAAGEKWLQTEKDYKEYELQFDFKAPGDEGMCHVFLPGQTSVAVTRRGAAGATRDNGGPDFWDVKRGGAGITQLGDNLHAKPGAWIRVTARCDKDGLRVTHNGNLIYLAYLKDKPPEGSIRFVPREGLEIMNAFVRELKEGKK